MMNKTFEYTYYVNNDDIDDLKHVNNLKYLEWALKAAELHWKEMSTDQIRKRYYWVVSRHEIDYFKSAFPGDKISIKTWIDKMYKAFSIRIVEIYKGKQLIAKVQTTWVLIDAGSHRVSRIPDSFYDFF